jgi:superoxide reductase
MGVARQETGSQAVSDRDSSLERTHVPMIAYPTPASAQELVPITVKVGDCPHPVEPGHYVQFIDLYVDEVFVSRVTFTPTAVKPKVTHYAVLEESVELRAVAFCTVHGFWESMSRIAFEP